MPDEAPPTLPDSEAALDLLAAAPVDEPEPEPAPQIVDDALLAALDSPIAVPPEDPEPVEEETEPTVADYKWKDTVLDKVLVRFDIDDREAFLEHALDFDANGNRYLTKPELEKAGKAWAGLHPPAEEEIEEESDALSASPEEDSSVVADAEPPEEVEGEAVVELPPPPLPEPAELPPPPLPEPAELPEPRLPDVEELSAPPLPVPAPEATVEVQASEEHDTEEEEASPVVTADYRELWKRRSDKSLPQMYGAIDRIGSGEVGSLLDRYADRFGHELDRDIIVMRKAEQDSRREAVPTVELISTPAPAEASEESDESEDDQEVDVELATWLEEVEDLLRPLQRSYKAADSKREKKRLAPALKVLIAERKALLSVISGTADDDILDDLPERPDMPELEVEEAAEAVSDEDEDFSSFFEVVNQLLGEMPEDWVNTFVASKGFALFQSVGENPTTSDEKTRKRFFKMIDNELGSMPGDMLDAFVSSPEFQLYQTMGERYGA